MLFNKFFNCKTLDAFNLNLESGKITDQCIAFIEETKQIWTHGQFYSCPYTKEEIDKLFSSSGSTITKADVERVLTGNITSHTHSYLPLTGTAANASKVSNPLTIKVNSGTTEGTNQYVYNGSSAKSLNIKAGSNVTLAASSGTLTISSTNTTYGVASTTANGLMSSSDKSKLDGIASGANKTIVDSALSPTSTNPVQNKVIKTELDTKMDIEPIVLTNQDLDNVKTTGIYAAAGGNSVTNKPDGIDSFGLKVYKAANSIIIQELTAGNSLSLTKYTRQYKYISENTYKWDVWKVSTSVFSSTPVSNQVVVAADSNGTLRTSGFTIGKSVPSDAKFTDTVYTLPTASSSVLGGVKVGSNITLSSGVISLTKSNVTSALGYTPPTSNTTYSAGTGLTLTGTSFSLSNSGVSAGSYGPTSNVSGSNGTTINVPQITVDAMGRVTSVTNRVYTSVDNNTVYTHPTSSGNKHIPSGGSSGQILRWSADGTAVWGNDNNTTYGQANSSTLGLVKIGFPESGKNYPVELNGSGQMFVNVPWTDTNTTYSTFKAATSSAAGGTGLVPAPAAGKQGQYLRGDGTWSTPTNTTYGLASTSANGLLRQLNGNTGQYMRGDGTWATPPNTTYGVVGANGSTGLIKNGSSVTSASGYTACPIVGGIPYYKDTNTTYNLGSFGVTASATELNYCKGVTSAIQTQLNGKAASSHNHNSSYVSALGTNGNYLTWTKNGATNNITVPYASNADTVDGYHQTAFSMGWTVSTKYRVDRWGGDQDKNWKKIVTYVNTGGGQYQSCKVKGTIYYITGNHNQAQVVDIPFEAIMYAYGDVANSILNSSTLYLPSYCTWDLIRIVRYANNSWEVQVRQSSDWTNISLEYTVTNNGGSVSAGQFTNTSYSSTVANNYNTNVSRPTSDRSYYSDSAGYVSRDRGQNTVSTLTSLPITKSTIIANLSKATNISLASNMNVGESITVICNPSSSFTQPIPTSGSFISMDGSSLSVTSGKKFEINIYCYNTNVYSISCKVAK